MPSISASAYTPGAKFHKSSFVFPNILWAQPSLLECCEVMIESWELSVTVLMYQCPGLWPAISILCIGCVIARARPPTQGELTIGAFSSCISMDGLCGAIVHINPKSEMWFRNFCSTITLSNFPLPRLPCWWFLGPADPFFRGSVLMDSWLMFLLTAGRPAAAAAGRAAQLGPANNE